LLGARGDIAFEQLIQWFIRHGWIFVPFDFQAILTHNAKVSLLRFHKRIRVQKMHRREGFVEAGEKQQSTARDQAKWVTDGSSKLTQLRDMKVDAIAVAGAGTELERNILIFMMSSKEVRKALVVALSAGIEMDRALHPGG